MRTGTKLILFILLISIMAAGGVRFYKELKKSKTAAVEKDQVKLLQEVIGIVRKSYVEEVDNKKLIQGAIDGMLTKLDPTAPSCRRNLTRR